MAKTKIKKAQDGPRRAGIYLRVSSEEQVNGTSLDVQEQACRARAEAEGWTVVQVFVDAGVSGAKKPGPGKGERQGLHAALLAVEAGQLDILLCTKIDRLGRSISVLASLWDRLAQAGVDLVPVGDSSYDDTSAGGRMYRTVMGALAELERELIKERTTSGRLARLREGAWAGGDQAPFGFRVERDADGRHPHLVIDEDEAATIRRAVELIVDQGLTTGEAAAALNAEGRLPRKADRWYANLLRILLQRGVYSGTWVYAKPAARVTEAPLEVTIPCLLSPERHAALRARLKDSSCAKVRSHPHPLSGMIVGAECQHVYTGVARADRGRRRYRCSLGKQNAGRDWICHAPTILAEDLDDAVWAEVCRVLRDPGRLQAAAEDYLGVLAGSAAAEADSLDKAEAQVVKCSTALSGAFTAGLKAGLDQDTLDQVVADLKADLKQAQDHADAIRAMQDSTSAQVAGLNQVQALALRLGDDLEGADPEWRRVVFRALGVQVRVPEIDAQGRPLAIEVSGADVLGLLRAGLDNLAPSDQGGTSPVYIGANVVVPFRLQVAA